MTSSKNKQSPNAFVLMGEAMSLVRQGGLGGSLVYYLGTMPFFVGLLYFWSDMSQSGFAQEHLVPGALLMTLAFVWMKGWQSIYARRLYALRLGSEGPSLGLKQQSRIFLHQAMLQPWGLLLLSLGLLLILPFGWLHALFQNLTVLDEGKEDQTLLKQAMDQAKQWGVQNALVIWILSPLLLAFLLVLCFGGAALLIDMAEQAGFYQMELAGVPWLFIGVVIMVLGVWPAAPLACTMAANLGLLLYVIPGLANSLFGVETIFLRAGIYGMANTTMVLTIYSLTHLLLDPILKATYVLRCFYGQAQSSGADILADLQRYARMAMLCLVLMAGLLLPSPASAEQATDPHLVTELDQAIAQTLEQPEYAWRVPRLQAEKEKKELDLGWLSTFLQPIGDWLQELFITIGEGVAKFFKWLGSLFDFKTEKPEGAAIDWRAMAKTFSIILAVAAGLVLLWQLLRLYRQRRPTLAVQEEGPAQVPDLASEEVSADLLPENEWLSLARDMLAKNEPRLALRALYLAGLAFLDQQQVIIVKPCKSNREYGREVKRLSHSYPELAGLFNAQVKLFEQVWFGDYPVAESDLNFFEETQNKMRSCLAPAQ